MSSTTAARLFLAGVLCFAAAYVSGHRRGYDESPTVAGHHAPANTRCEEDEVLGLSQGNGIPHCIHVELGRLGQ